ncbi:MAG: hypothetical protein AAF267_23720 [Deinococcota bacterium]
MANSGVLVPPEYVKALRGNGNAAIYLSQLVYWQKQYPGQEFYVKAAQLEVQTGFGRATQAKARKLLVSLGLISYQRKGLPAMPYFKVNFEALEALISPFVADAQYVEPIDGQYVTHQRGEQANKNSSFLPLRADAQYVAPIDEHHIETTKAHHVARQVFITSCDSYKEEEIKDKTKKKKDQLTRITSKPQPAKQPPLSAEEKFHEQTRRRLAGEHIAKTSLDESQWQRHLQNLIGSNFTRKQVQENWQRWYRDFGVDFVEAAWKIAAETAADHRTGKPVFAFVDLFDSYGNYRELASLMYKKRQGEQKHTRAAPPKIERGQDALLNGQRVHVQEVDHEGYFAYLGDAEGTRVLVEQLEALS